MKSTKKRIGLVTLAMALAMCLFLAACGGSGSSAAASGSTAGGSAAGAAKDTLTMASPTDIDGLDPQMTNSLISMKMVTQIYDTLIKADPEGGLHPQLAESWEVSDDGLSYTFKLKQGVKFHNGEEMKASDVAFSISRGIESPYSGAIFGPVESAEVVDDYTVNVNLKYAYTPFLSGMSAPLASIVSQKAAEEFGEDFLRNPVGTGAYEFVSWGQGDRVVLKAFDGWHGGAAPIPNLVFRVLADTTTSVIALEKGEVDLLLEVPPSDRENIQGNDKLALYERPSHRQYYIGFNTETGPFADLKLREAVALAVDREGITLVASEGLGEVAQNHLTSTIFGYSDEVKWYEQNLDEAKKLVDEAGAAGLTANVICQDGAGKKIAQVLQENLAQLGINCNIEVLDRAAHNEKGKNGDFDIIINSWSTPVADADYTVNFLFHSKMIGAMNLARYNSPKMDELIIQGETQSDENERKATYKEILEQLKTDIPTIPIYFETVSLAADKNLKNVVPSPSSTYYFYDLSW